MSTISDKRKTVPFVMIDHALIDACVLDSYELAVYVVIARFVNYQSGVAFPSIKKLTDLLQCGRKRIMKSISGLEEKGLLKVYREDGEVNHYELLDFEQPVPQKDGGSPSEGRGVVPQRDTKKIKINKVTEKDSAPNGAGQNSDPNQQLQRVDVNPKTSHQKLFEYVANQWYKAYKYNDGNYYFQLNGEMQKVSGGEIGSAIKRFKKHFGDKMKLEDLEPFVKFYNERCTNVLSLPRSEFALLKWINEWKVEIRRFNPNAEDPYANLVVSEERNSNGK